MSVATDTPQGATFRVRLVPRSSRNLVDGLHGDAVKIRLRAPPVDGKANRALVRFLAGQLDVPASSLAITAGHAGRRKRLLVAGLSAADVVRRLGLGGDGFPALDGGALTA
jgi:uncharacterized protein (TIGR00251 family)